MVNSNKEVLAMRLNPFRINRIYLSYTELRIVDLVLDVLNKDISPRLAKYSDYCDNREWRRLMDLQIAILSTSSEKAISVVRGWVDNYPLRFRMRLELEGRFYTDVKEIRWQVKTAGISAEKDFLFDGVTRISCIQRFVFVMSPGFTWENVCQYQRVIL